MEHKPKYYKNKNEALKRLRVAPVSLRDAKRIITSVHYMKTFPQGARVALGALDGSKVAGLIVFGQSTSTHAKVGRLVDGVSRAEQLELQRMWVHDRYGHNTESWFMARCFAVLRKAGVRIVVTHSGGCKNDCGIVYQASGWLYFGKSRCQDFYLTKAGQYRNMVAARRFGQVDAKGKTAQEIGEKLFGPGEVVDSWRYNYAFPVDRGLRDALEKKAMAYPKDSVRFRKNQEWVDTKPDESCRL